MQAIQYARCRYIKLLPAVLLQKRYIHGTPTYYGFQILTIRMNASKTTDESDRHYYKRNYAKLIKQDVDRRRVYENTFIFIYMAH